MTAPITKPLTLSGRYFSKKELRYIQQTIESFPNLSFTELAQTLCEHLRWFTPTGRNKINACFTVLEKMQKHGLVVLPERQQKKKRQQKKIIWSAQSDACDMIDCDLDALGKVRLEVVTGKADIRLWNELVDRYHYLHYKHPMASAIKYFIVADQPQRQILGCLLFSAPVWHLADRDEWIGWNKRDREQRLNRVINNSRFLILPWVNVPNLASFALSLVSRQIADDWQAMHAVRPVLIETFVDDSRYSGTCYQAANWQGIGKTSGKDWKADTKNLDGTVKSIFVQPLQANFRAVLKNLPDVHKKSTLDTDFLNLWGNVVATISEVAADFDALWQKRKRLIDSLLLVFLIFRLVLSKNSQSYGTTISEFWHHCHRMKFPLPQKAPICASAFADARKKLDESIFQVLNTRILQVGEDKLQQRWFGHHLFAVDGSKINLPRELLDAGYSTPSDNAYYPQGLLSCCYQLRSKVPYDFDLVSHGNERKCAIKHLKALRKDDVVIYDRGYFSYAMLHQHAQTGIHAIFRLQKKAGKAIEAFMESDKTDQIITLLPLADRQREIRKHDPNINFIPLKLRLIKYVIDGNSYAIGTTLMDSKYTLEDFRHVYHERWGVEELYKSSKQLMEVDDFHGRSERGVKQELFAHFVLITMSRLCSNESEGLLNNLINPDSTQETTDTGAEIQVNFKNTLTTVSRYLEDIFFAPARCVKNVMTDIIHSISRYHQKVRTGRSYERKSRKPISKWKGCQSSP